MRAASVADFDSSRERGAPLSTWGHCCGNPPASCGRDSQLNDEVEFRACPLPAPGGGRIDPIDESLIEQRGERCQDLATPFEFLDEPHLRPLRVGMLISWAAHGGTVAFHAIDDRRCDRPGRQRGVSPQRHLSVRKLRVNEPLERGLR